MLDHRKAVGGFWDEVGQGHIQTLKQQGLKPHHLLLEFGCGSLRGACRTIPYLEPGHYFGIEPAHLLVEAGIKNELSDDLLEEKQPTFSFSNQMRLPPDDEDRRFDFIISQAVFTHFGPESLERFLFFAKSKLAPEGKVLVSLHFSKDGVLDLGKPILRRSIYEEDLPDARDLPALVFRTKVFYPRYLVKQIVDITGFGLSILPWRHPGKFQRVSQRMLLLSPRD